jgi:hypothetical protein
MGGRSGGTQEVVQRTEPDAFTQQWRGAIGNAAQNLYNQGPAPFYPGSTVVPFSNQTQAGLDWMQNQAMQGAPLQGQAYNAAGRMMSGFTPGMGVALNAARGGLDAQTGMNPFTQDVRQSGMTNIAGAVAPQALGAGQFNPFMAGSAMAGAQQTQMGVQPLQQMAQGGSNPQLDALFGQGANQIRNQVDAAFARSGMTGSAAHQGEFQEGLNNLFANTYGAAYETDRNRQLNAAGQLAGIDQGNRAAMMQGLGQAGGMFNSSQGLGLQGLGLFADAATGDASRNMAAASGAAGLSSDDFARLLQAQGLNAGTRLAGAELAGGMFDRSNQNALRGIAALPQIYDYGMQPGRTMMGVGGAYEDMAGQYLADDMARYNYANDAQWNNLGRLADMMNGLPMGQIGTQISPRQRTNPMMGALGGLSAGAGIFSALGGAGTGAGMAAMGPLGWGALGIGGLLGLLGSRG